MSEQLWWYIARSTGIVAWALLAAGVIWGLTISTSRLGGAVLGTRARPNWLLDLHRFLGGLAVVFTGVHLGALVLDRYVDLGLTELLVPMASSYRPGAVAWGVAGLYLLIAVEVTSLLRRTMSKRAWRMTHMLSFPLLAVATVHGLTAGTDATGGALFWSMVSVSVLVFALTVARIDQARHHERDRGHASPRSRSLTPPTAV
jgi:DMSO/TMAO reductase YedYZ heme-binding membrane subunit